jgi:acetylornithine deacetylase/succinyl-diaminopimelate desuccinylase-like protein
LQAVEAFLRARKVVPVNVKFLLEGQEEIGSPHLAQLLEKHKRLLAADFALSADGAQISEKEVPLLLQRLLQDVSSTCQALMLQ